MGLTFTCTAYQLLAQYGRNVDVGDWFASFCLALGAPAAADDGAGGSKKRRRAPKKRRKMKTVERNVQGGAAADAGADGALGEAGPAVRWSDQCTNSGMTVVHGRMVTLPLRCHRRAWPVKLRGHARAVLDWCAAVQPAVCDETGVSRQLQSPRHCVERKQLREIIPACSAACVLLQPQVHTHHAS